tara:strand:- start:121 stop:1395 length:1275 start_codon:yes stop_codon:yes gene_type:complete
MRHAIGGLAALLLGAGLLLLGHGMLTTLLAVRGEIEGFGAGLIGGIGTAYYLGFFSGCVLLPPLMRRVGHIRMFAAAGALVAASTLAQGLFVDAIAWLPIRYVTGFAMATVFMAVESWLNVRATNETRGQVYAIYMLINLGAAMLAQQGLRLAPPGEVTLFAVAALLICLGLLPVALTRSEQPPRPPDTRLDIRGLFRLSPMGTVGSFLSGLITSPFWVLGPVYSQRLGYDLATTTLFMSLVIAGGTIMQWPLGWLSDRLDRRSVLIGVFGVVAVVSALLAADLGLNVWLWLALSMAFGGAAFCVNALCVSHVNDVMIDQDRIAVSAGLLLLFGAGAVIGPILAGQAMARLGPGGMFMQIAAVAIFGMIFAIVRRKMRAAPPNSQKDPFVATAERTPSTMPLDPRVPVEQAGLAPATEPADAKG